MADIKVIFGFVLGTIAIICMIVITVGVFLIGKICNNQEKTFLMEIVECFRCPR